MHFHTPLTTGKLILALVAALVTSVWLCTLDDVQSQYALYRESNDLRESNITADHLLAIGQNLIFERGRAFLRLSALPPTDATSHAFIDQRRQDIDADLNAVLARLPADRADRLRAAKARLDQLRPLIDRDLALPHQARDGALRDFWLRETSKIVHDLADMVRASILHPKHFSRSFRLMTRIKLAAIDLWDVLDEETSRIGATAASGRPLSTAELIHLAGLRSRADVAWAAILTDAALADTPAFAPALGAVQTALSDRLRPLQDRITAASLNGHAITMPPADYSAIAMPALDQVTALIAITRQETRLQADRSGRQAATQMVIQLGLTLACLALGVTALVVLRRRLLGPLRHLREDLRRLARGELNVPLTQPRHHDELGEMQAAIIEFRNILSERQSLWNALPDFICSKDAEGRWKTLNAAAVTLFGVDQDICRGKDDAAMPSVTPHLEPWLLSAATVEEAIWRKGTAISREEVIPDRNGDARFFQVVRVPLFHADGSRRGTMMLGRDVTDRRRAEAAMARLAQQNQLLLDCAGEGIAGLDAQGRITFVNPAAERITGWDALELVGQPQHDLMHHHRANGSEYPAAQCPIHKTLGDGQTRHCDRELFWCKDGSSLPVELTVTPILEQGGVRGAVIIFRDIRSRLAAEAEIDTLLEELKRSNSELERFAYVASHDLRQPLRMITSYLSLLVRRMGGRLTADEQEFIDYAVDGANRMDRMILDLLDYSRIGRTSDVTAVPLAEVMASATVNLQTAITEAKAEITISSDLPVVTGVRSELERLFQNLIANAVKFHADDRVPQITITCAGHAGEWVIAVRDNGIGIDPQHHDRLFNIFQRLVSQAQYDGTGIGLASCRKIAEHHNGRIWIESTAGLGSTFFVALPKATIWAE